MFGLGLPELIVVLVLVLVFFGKDKLPELARGIGGAIRELRSAFTDEVKGKDSDHGDAKPAGKK